MLSKKVDTILVGFEDAKNRLPKAKRVVVTGTPTKTKNINLSDVEKKKIRKDLKLSDELPLILVFGGSQGAKVINDTLIDIIKNKQNSNYQIIWAAGPSQFDEIKQELQDFNLDINNIDKVKIVPYIYNMEEIMNTCDLVIARSGAMTLAEIALAGKAAIFIPLPSMSANRQEDNARVFERMGAAKVILNSELNSEILSKTISEIIAYKEKLEDMGNRAKQMAIYNVEDKIYEEVKRLLKK